MLIAFHLLGIRLASLIIPLLIHYLPDSDVSSSMNSQHVKQHASSHIIERIQYLIPIYSNEFRLILQTCPDLRLKLESALRRQQQQQQHKQQRDDKQSSSSSKAYLTSFNTAAQIAPLRIDFSNFKST
jgi:hypothetical protein